MHSGVSRKELEVSGEIRRQLVLGFKGETSAPKEGMEYY